MNREVLKKIADEFCTPQFIFDTDEFSLCAGKVKKALGDRIPLCFSIKANPFLLAALPESISNVEVCSPGELEICKALKIKPEMIIYSGVNKGTADVMSALNYNVGLVTAESLKHVDLFNKAAIKLNKKVDIILRLTSGNQFGMDKKDLADVIDNREKYKGLNIVGLHYYSGTQKRKISVIEKDIENFKSFIGELVEKHNFSPTHIEYGPGIAAEYFNLPCEEKDEELLNQTCQLLKKFGQEYNLTVEMGRFLASSCGTYITGVADIKCNESANYVICDGGINQLKYYGQTMAMQVPPITVLNDERTTCDYTLCGSLCTTADLLVRKVTLPKLCIGDVIAFHRCGAYTITEGIGLFLSRELPRVVLYSKQRGACLARDFYPTHKLNTPEMR